MEKTEFPKYKCHKEVRAAKIAIVEHDEQGTIICFANYKNIRVTNEFVQKHNPMDGMYYVIYEDGYASISPAKAFEEGYTLIEG